MDRDRLLKARELFAAAAPMGAAERQAYLAGAGGADPDLLAHVTTLLAAHDRAGDFLANATVGVSTLAEARANTCEMPGAAIGPYRILQLIGEGGFGSVYLAEQEHPVRRQVALKLIKAGMDTRQVIARFDAERQALALMDHPNIARVLDAGATESGRPFFVMELVKGVPLTDYCDANHLPTAQRLELFVQVCRAVQHAHQKGVIHRDIKPSNVLVTLHDGQPVPKVIDFGIAKATEAPLTEKTLLTEIRQLVGTPAYMSPEQAEMAGVDVDTRSDIYSLGVLMYELLTGTTPFDARELRAAAFGEVRRIIREVEPPAPSTRLGTMGEALTAVAARRRTEPAKLGQSVRGELDWIVMKALEKERARRYDTASALAEDVQRYLRDELVLARPPAKAYLARKFIRRHKVGIVTASAVAAAVVLGLGVATVGFVRASRERDRAFAARFDEKLQRLLTGVALVEAEQARADADKARERAEQAHAHALDINDLLHELFAAVNSRRTGDGATFDRILTGAANKVDTGALAEQPQLEAAVRCDLGWLLQRKGDLDGAEQLLREGLDLNRRLVKPDDPAIATNLHSLAMVLMAKGGRDEAMPLVRESLKIRLAVCDATIARDPAVARPYADRAHLRARTGDFAGALADYTSALDRNDAEHLWWLHRAAIRLYTGDADAYRDDCRRMTEKFLAATEPQVAERAIKTCLLVPDPSVDLETLREPMHRVISAKAPMYYVKWFQVAQGMYEYRLGRYESALKWLGRGRDGVGSPQGRALADFFAAMAMHRLGNMAGAERALSSGIKLTPDDPWDLANRDPMESGSTVGNWVFARIARREAEQLVRGAPGANAPSAGAAETSSP